MTPRKLKREVSAIANIGIIVLVAVLMVSASSVVVLLVQGQGQQGPTTRHVKEGDDISVNYIGQLEDGRVFDTSLYSVAIDNAGYPKSLSFTLRSQQNYTPLKFTVGSGNVIKGFEEGVVGMTIGQTRVITVPPDKGYGQIDLSKTITADLVNKLPILESLNTTQFESRYGETPSQGLVVLDPVYKWPVNVLLVYADADAILVMNMPTVGQKYPIWGDPSASPATGWYAQVLEMDSTANGGQGQIVVQNLLTSADAGMIKGVTPSSIFIVDKVDTAAGTFRMNFNGELVGVNLVFTVTLLSFV